MSGRRYCCVHTFWIGREPLTITCGHEHATVREAVECQRRMQALGGCWVKRTTEGEALTAEETAKGHAAGR